MASAQLIAEAQRLLEAAAEEAVAARTPQELLIFAAQFTPRSAQPGAGNLAYLPTQAFDDAEGDTDDEDNDEADEGAPNVGGVPTPPACGAGAVTIT